MNDRPAAEAATERAPKRPRLKSGYATLPHKRTRAPIVGPGIRKCKECGTEFPAKRAGRASHQDFCNGDCRYQWNQRRMLRGLAIIADIMRWRGDRKDKDALADVCHKVSIFLDEDKKAGRPSW